MQITTRRRQLGLPRSSSLAVDRGAGVVATVVVAVTAAAASSGFRWLVVHGSTRLGRPTSEAWGRPAVVVFALCLTGLALAWATGRWARRVDVQSANLGSVINDQPARAWRVGAIIRSAGTLVASVGLASMGREVAVLELGALSGEVGGRASARRRGDLVGVGIAAAFAAAYHAPFAGVCFVLDHVLDPAPRGRTRRERVRFAAHVVAGAAIGQLVSNRCFGGRPLLTPPAHHDLAVVAVAVALTAPAVVVVKGFVAARSALARWADRPARAAVLLVVAAGLVAAFPTVSGNGLESLRGIAPSMTIGAVLVLVLGRLIATSATLGAGVPGGMFSPTLLLAGGTAAAVLTLADRVGVPLGTHRWDAVLLVAGVGVALALRSPLVGALIIPEMTGHLGLLPITAAIVFAGWFVGRERSRPTPA